MITPVVAAAQSLSLVHQGYLLEANDAPVTNEATPLSFKVFALSNRVESETALWSSGACPTPVSRGFYSVVLGASCGTGLEASVFSATEARYLEVSINGAPLAPRLRFGMAPIAGVAVSAQAAVTAQSALVAKDAEKLGGHEPAYFLDAANLTGTLPAALTGSLTTAIPAATAGGAGLLSATDKAKLDALPAAIVTQVTGTAPVSVTSGPTPVVSVAAATSTSAGLLSATDKAKLDALPTNPLTALAGTAPVTVTSGATTTIAVSEATSGSAGLMSSTDKVKLDGLSAGVTSGGTRPTSPVAGQFFLNTSTRDLEFWDGQAWRLLSAYYPVPTNGLILQLDANESATVVRSGSNVTTWKDRSNAGNDVTPAGPSSSVPQYLTTSPMRGRAAIFFNNSKYFRPAQQAAFDGQALSFFVVAHFTDLTDQWNYLLGKDGFWGTGYGITAKNAAFGAYVGNGDPVMTSATATGTTYVFSVVMNASTISFWRDGALQTTQNHSTVNSVSADYTIGNSWNAGSAAYGITGYVGEVLHYNRALTDSERGDVERYLGAKWK